MAVHHTSSNAYDLSLFEEREKRSDEKQLRVVRNTHYTGLLFGLSPMAVVFVAAVVVAITSLFIYNNVMLTEIGAQINTVSNSLAELENENVILQASLESKMSVKNIENKAENELGLIKMDRSQVQYVNLAPEDVVEVTEPDLANGNLLERAIAKIKEYLNR